MSDYDQNQECDGICLMSLDVLSFQDGGRFDVPAAVHPGCPRHDPGTIDRELVDWVVRQHQLGFDPGSWPLLVAATYKQGTFWANQYNIKHRFIAVVGYPHMFDGARPSSILYAPGWYLGDGIEETEGQLAMIRAMRAHPVPIHYILEGRF